MRIRYFAAVALFLAAALPARASGVLVGEYKLPASLDTEVSTLLPTEEWAVVFRPEADGTYPLVLMLHGNHGTCGHFDKTHHVRIDDNIDYTFDGTCPAGYVVTPNHRGYDYLAEDLAKHGYVVVSINANRGINGASGDFDDFGLNLTRGRLVLRHMEYLSQWNANGGAPDSLGFSLTHLIDFSHVGLMGHSRGGEGVRAAVAQYNDAGSPWPGRIGPVNFEAMFEIGPVDGQTNRILNNTGMAWNVLLPGCDGDVSDLEGMKPYDRGLAITSEKNALNKSTFEVFGANHNFYNTEWQLSDSGGCSGETPLFGPYKGSKTQRQTAHDTLLPFFLAHLGPDAKLKKARIFDPSYPLPAKLVAVTPYQRGFTAAPRAADNLIVDNFDQATGTSSEGVPNQSHGLVQYNHGFAGHSDDGTQRAAALSWSSSGGFLQVNAAKSGHSIDASAFPALEFRVALRCSGNLCSLPSDPAGDVDFSVALADADNTLSTAVVLKDVARVYRPVGVGGETNTIFQTVRVPLSAFTGVDAADVRGVHFTFDRTNAAAIYLADVRFSHAPAGPGGLPDTLPRGFGAGNAVTATHSGTVATRPQLSEIELTSPHAFPIGDAMPVLTVGGHSFRFSRFTRDGHLVFRLTPQEFSTAHGDVSLRDGAGTWTFGRI